MLFLSLALAILDVIPSFVNFVSYSDILSCFREKVEKIIRCQKEVCLKGPRGVESFREKFMEIQGTYFCFLTFAV